MLPFLQKTAQYLVSEFPDNLADICIVLPNRRGGLFLRKYLAAGVGKVTWAPTIFSIEDFIAEISGLQEVESLHLLFELYEIHKDIDGKNAQTFEEFLRWAPQLISDFNEIDQYMVNAKELFSTLTEARAIALWNIDGQPLTEFEKKYLHFYQSLFVYYDRLTKRLSDKNHAYQGLSFRHAAGNIGATKYILPWRHIVFAGFNALTKAEEQIIGTLRREGKATLLWDADKYYLDNLQQEAGDFLRDWLRKWPGKEACWIFDDFATSVKQIEIIGSPDPVGQVKYCGHLLQELAKNDRINEKTAVVLLDEGLLIPLLNSIPNEIEALNITAGLPLKQTPLASLFETVFQLHLNTARFTYLVSKGIRKYYYKDVLQLLQHPYIHRMACGLMKGNRFIFDETIDRIRMGHQIFIGFEDIVGENSGLFSGNMQFLESMFSYWTKSFDALSCFKLMIETLRTNVKDSMELEYLFAFSKIVHQLGNLISEFQTDLKITALYELYQQVISGTSLPFYGEPLKGVQLMGMLETRTLDFENLVILSCNEDLLPKNKINASFIPFDIRRNFDLPTYRQKNSVYAYHFYRLIQRAKHVWILYNTEPDQLGGGERSRFLRQITSELSAYNPQIRIRESILTTPALKSKGLPVIEIPKTEATLAALEDKAVKGFSASSLNSYRNCALKFYYAEIAGIREPEQVDDTIDPAVLGSAVHEALNNLYKPFIDTPLTKDTLSAMENASEAAVDHAFEKKFKGSDITYGKNLLLVRVAKLMIKRFLHYEADEVDHLKKLEQTRTVAFLEKFIETLIRIPFGGKDLDIRLKGFIDRVDTVDGYWRIIDYKTGTTEPKQIRVKDWDDLIVNPDLNIGFQLLMYSYLLNGLLQYNAYSTAGIISLKRINAGFLTVSTPGDEPGKFTTSLDETSTKRFEEVLKVILSDVYDLTKPFSQTSDLKICEWCPYINLCGR
ncbi:MAG: PD-(D/E)XK nuclease family protein [Bacteroidales bacterium]|nr:PD-(D/E)XK nuclease family protein [Bacteroidales bacterium]